MTRLCLNCSENSKTTSCICMTTATEKYSLTEGQIIEARIPLVTNAIPNGNLKLLPESIVLRHALKAHGSMANIRLVFEENKRARMVKYDIRASKWESESENFDHWVQSKESIWGTRCGWPEECLRYYLSEKERLKKKPKFPRQAFEVNDTHTAGREAGTTKYLARKVK